MNKLNATNDSLISMTMFTQVFQERLCSGVTLTPRLCQAFDGGSTVASRESVQHHFVYTSRPAPAVFHHRALFLFSILDKKRISSPSSYIYSPAAVLDDMKKAGREILNYVSNA